MQDDAVSRRTPQLERSGFLRLALALLALNGVLFALLLDLKPRSPEQGPLNFATVAVALLVIGLLLLAWQRQKQQALEAELRGREAQAAAELRFKTIFDQATAGIGLIGDDATWLEVNARLCELTGYEAGELRGLPLSELLPPEEREPYLARMRAFLADAEGPAEYSVESRWRRRDGSSIWLSRHVRRLPRAAGMPGRALLIAIDISDRKRAEEAAVEQRQLEVFQFAESPMALIEWAADMSVKRWSRQAETMFGWTEAEMVGRTLRQSGFLTGAEADQHEALMREVLDGRCDTVESLRYCRRKDGSGAWCRWYSRAMRSAGGGLRYFFSAGIDVSELRFAHDALDQKERQLRAIFERASVGIALLDERGGWLSVNPRICEITGYSHEELLKIDFQTITHPDDLSADTELANKVVTGEIDHYTIEKRYLHKDGHVVWIRLQVGRVDATASTPMRFVSVIEDISEARRVEREAQELKRIRDFHLDNTPLAAVEWTPDMRVLRWSKSAERLFGWTEAELLGLRLGDWPFIHEQDRAATESYVRELLVSNARSGRHTNRNYRKDGSLAWCDWHGSVLRDESGAVVSFFTLATDVTEQLTMLQALHENESQLRGVFEQAAVGIAMLDETGRWLSVNQRLCDMLGYTREELLQLDYPRLTHPDDVQANLELSKRVYSGVIANFTLDKRYLRKDGSPVWVTLYIRRIDATGSAPLRCAAIIEDITERKRAEAEMLALHQARESTMAALGESEARFRSIFEQAAVGIAMLDAGGRWLMANERFGEIVGYPLEDLLRLGCTELSEPEDWQREAVQRGSLIAGAIDEYRIEKRYRKRDGSPVWVSVSARRLASDEGQPVRLSLVVEDISARRESEQKLQELRAELERKVVERTRQLQETTRRWGERSQELGLLAEMMGVLPAARDVREANLIVARFLPRLFRRCGGEVWIEDETPNRFHRIVDWNLGSLGPKTVGVDDCWALRRGQPLHVDDPLDPLVCPHCGDVGGEQTPHACMPVLALGEAIGLIHLRWSERVDASGEANAPPDRSLLSSVAEQIGLAIGNVRLREELRQQALRDPLTGLYNRRHFQESVNARVAEQRRSGRGFALLLIDIDHFKAVNDNHGHDAGDEVLRSVGALLQRSARADEAAFRLGGEEFVMLINDDHGADLAGCAERLRREVETLRIEFGGAPLPKVTVSIGAAHLPGDADDATVLIHRADQALYAAKRTGRNRVCYAGAQQDQPASVAAIEPRKDGPKRRKRPLLPSG